MDDLKNALQHQPDIDGEDNEEITVARGGDVTTAIRAATGLNIPKEVLNGDEDGIVISKPKSKKKSTKTTTGKSSGSSMSVLTPEEASQLLGNVTPQKIEVEKELDAARNAHMDELAKQQGDSLTKLVEGAVATEEARLKRHEEALEDPEQVKKIYKDQTPGANGGKVNYTAPIGDSQEDDVDETPKMEKGAQRTERIHMDMEINTQVDANLDSLVPTYTTEPDDTDEEPTPKKKEEADNSAKRPSPKDSEEEYAAFVRTLPIVDIDAADDTVVDVIKEKTELQQVPSGRQKKDKIIGDQSFINAINKFKRDNFRTVSVPLVNSGFIVDIVGTGAVDLNQLYSVVDENTLLVDYELEKMRVIMKAVVDTHPKINPTDLRNMIHFADYQMMAYAHVAATLKDVELVTTCNECGKDFHIVADSKDLLLNMSDMRDKMLKIRQSTTIRECSLMSTNLDMSTSDGFRIILGHPSYGEYVLYLTELKAIINRLDPSQSARIRKMSDSLPYVRGIQMPNGIHANNLFQRYMAITMLSDDAKDELDEGIERLKKEIIFPRFGVRKVRCPHCGKVNTDIYYDNLEDLLFFHFMVTRWMKNTEQSSDNG